MTKHDKFRVLDYLEHITEAIQRINNYIDDTTELGFIENHLIQDAVIHNLQVIGEACRNIEKHYPEFVQRYPALPVRAAYEMRNALAHGYFKIDLEIVWNTIQSDLPKLGKQIQKVYKQLKAEESNSSQSPSGN